MKRYLAFCVAAAAGLVSAMHLSGANRSPSKSKLGVPQLPDKMYNYADVDFPEHFWDPDRRFGAMIDADNTPADNPITDAGATLGRVLFYDKRLSANDSVSCGSCHQQKHGFSDPARFSKGLHGKPTRRHSMSLTNARFYARGRFFWDERAATLEEQVLMPIQDPVEMGMKLDDLEQKLTAVDFYAPLFEAAFGSPEVTRDRISKALAQFVRSLVSYQSKFDRAYTINPDGPPAFEKVFNKQELLGQRLFMGDSNQFGGSGQSSGSFQFGGSGFSGKKSFKFGRQGRSRGGPPVRSALCSRCHGTVGQISRKAHNNGLDLKTDKDQGAGDGRFKAPSLRNIAVRAPYMHDGRFRSLRDVIVHYSTGVQNHPKLDRALAAGFFYEIPDNVPFGQPERFLPNFGPGRLNLSKAEINALVAFLNTLTDHDFLTDPRFSDPFASADDRRLANRPKRSSRTDPPNPDRAKNRERIAQKALQSARQTVVPRIRNAKLQLLVRRFKETQAAQEAQTLLDQKADASP